jgi:hypothetical protein
MWTAQHVILIVLEKIASESLNGSGEERPTWQKRSMHYNLCAVIFDEYFM